MKYYSFILVFVLCGTTLMAQDWVKKMNNPDANFFEVEKSFNKHWKKQQRKEKLKSFFTSESKNEEENEGLMLFKRWEYTTKPRVFPSGNRNLLHESGKEIERAITDPVYRSSLQAGGIILERRRRSYS